MRHVFDNSNDPTGKCNRPIWANDPKGGVILSRRIQIALMAVTAVVVAALNAGAPWGP
jgi:hypothetical protein